MFWALFVITGFVMFHFDQHQLFYVLGGMVLLYGAIRSNLDVARKVLPKLKIGEHDTPEKREEIRDQILMGKAEAFVYTTLVAQGLVIPWSMVYLGFLFWTLYAYPLSWKAFAFLIPTAGHFFMLWVARNHRIRVLLNMGKLSQNDQAEVLRLAQIFRNRLRPISS